MWRNMEQVLGAAVLVHYWTLYFTQWAVSQRQTQLVGSHFAIITTQDTNPRQQHIENKAIREVMKREKHATQ